MKFGLCFTIWDVLDQWWWPSPAVSRQPFFCPVNYMMDPRKLRSAVTGRSSMCRYDCSCGPSGMMHHGGHVATFVWRSRARIWVKLQKTGGHGALSFPGSRGTCPRLGGWCEPLHEERDVGHVGQVARLEEGGRSGNARTEQCFITSCICLIL